MPADEPLVQDAAVVPTPGQRESPGTRSRLRGSRGTTRYTVAVVAFGLVVVSLHGSRQGYLLDDWYVARNGALGGFGGLVDRSLLLARPGSFLAYASTFGLGGDPLAVHVGQVAWLLTAAALAHRLLCRFFPVPPSTAVVALWLLLPNHMSLEVWGSAVVANVSLVLLLGGCLALSHTPLSKAWIGLASVLFSASCLTYEASLLPAALAFVVIPPTRDWVTRLRIAAVGVLVLGMTVVWQLLNWHSVKSANTEFTKLALIGPGHFGWGVVPAGAPASTLLILVLLGSVVAVSSRWLPSFKGRTGGPERMVALGWLVMVSGTAAFALYYYAPLGAGDRVNYVSGLGGAMVLVGLLWRLTTWSRPAAIVVIVLLVSGATVVRVDRTNLWETAANDSRALAAAIEAAPGTCSFVVVGPEPIQQQNVAVFLDQSNVQGAVQLIRRSGQVSGGIAYGQEAFESVPSECRVDIRDVSGLVADVDLTP